VTCIPYSENGFILCYQSNKTSYFSLFNISVYFCSFKSKLYHYVLCICMIFYFILVSMCVVLFCFVVFHLLVSFRHSLLDSKINSVLSLCHDRSVLNAVQRIIHNTILYEDPSQQQLSYLQSESLYIVCLEAGQSAFLHTQLYLSTNLDHILFSNVYVLMCHKAVNQSIQM